MEQKSKSHLALMEQAIMILVFAFAAAICVQAFQKADATSKELAARDRAVNYSQTVAETVKSVHGDLESAAGILGGIAKEDKLLFWYDNEWNRVSKEGAAYELCLMVTETSAYLEKSQLIVTELKKSKVLFALPVNWQKEVPHE